MYTCDDNNPCFKKVVSILNNYTLFGDPLRNKIGSIIFTANQLGGVGRNEKHLIEKIDSISEELGSTNVFKDEFITNLSFNLKQGLEIQKKIQSEAYSQSK